MMNRYAVLATISLVAFATSAQAQEMHGVVKKEHVRLERPQISLRPLTPMTSGISDSGFTLHAEQGNNQSRFNLNAQSNIGQFGAQDWDPFPSSHHGYLGNYPPSNYPSAASTPNYAASEQEYAAHTPFPGSPRPSWGASRAGFQAALESYPSNYMDNNVPVTRENVISGQRPRLAVDSCQCDTAIPSDSCMRSRMQGFGTNITPTIYNTPYAMQNTPAAFSPASMHHMR